MMFEDVADTAIWVAAYRAMESERPDALFHDPLAQKLAGDRGWKLARDVYGAKNFAWMLAVRTVMIDEMVESAIACGATTVLNLGAGMDARPYRMKLPASLRWIEVDHPKIIERKSTLLAKDAPVCALERIPADLSRMEERRAIFERIDGETLVLTEGVIGYLSNDDVWALSRDLHARANFRRWIVDYSSPMLDESMRRRRRVKAQFRNAVLQFAPGDWEAFFANAGWSVETMRYHVIVGETLGRNVPLPIHFRALLPFMPAKRREELRRMMGHATLRRDQRAKTFRSDGSFGSTTT